MPRLRVSSSARRDCSNIFKTSRTSCSGSAPARHHRLLIASPRSSTRFKERSAVLGVVIRDPRTPPGWRASCPGLARRRRPEKHPGHPRQHAQRAHALRSQSMERKFLHRAEKVAARDRVCLRGSAHSASAEATAPRGEEVSPPVPRGRQGVHQP